MRGPVGMLLLCTAVAASSAASPVSLESRSHDHSLLVEVSGNDHYKIRITDLGTNETLLSADLVGLPAETAADLRDLHITARIGAAPYGITTTAEIERGDMLIDSLHTVWTLTPHRARLRAAGALRVGGDVKPPAIVRRVEPAYTDDARRDRIAGVVVLEMLVDKTGAVKDAIVLKGLPDGLADAAVAAVKQWAFQPAMLNGEPVDVIFDVTVNFKPE